MIDFIFYLMEYITILAFPQIVQFPHDMNITSGQSLNLFCNGTGHPLPKLRWFKNNLMLENTFVFNSETGTESWLIIENTSSIDAGSYYCILQNKLTRVISPVAKIKIFGKSSCGL